jgi:hypothetical protein
MALTARGSRGLLPVPGRNKVWKFPGSMVDIARSMSVKSRLIGDGEVNPGDECLSKGDEDRDERVVRVSKDL